MYSGVQQKLHLKLPVTPNKFIEPTEMNSEAFFARWKNLSRSVALLTWQSPGNCSVAHQSVRQFVRHGYRILSFISIFLVGLLMFH